MLSSGHGRHLPECLGEVLYGNSSARRVQWEILGDCANSRGSGSPPEGGFGYADDDVAATKRRDAARLSEQAEANLKDDNYEQCLQDAERAVALLKDIGASAEAPYALRLMVDAYRLESILTGDGRPTKAIAFAREQAEGFAGAGNRHGEACMRLALAGMLAFDLRGAANAETALSSAEEALDLFTSISDRRMEGVTWQTLASIYFLLGKVSDVAKAAEKALAIAKSLGDKVSEAKALHAVALSYLDTGDYESTTVKAREAASAYAEAGDVAGQAVELLVASMWCMQADKPHRAQAMAEEALKLHRTAPGKGSGRKAARHALALMILVEALIARRQEKKALKVALEGVAWFAKAGDDLGKAYAMEVVIHANTRLGKVDDAISKGTEAVALVQGLKDKRMEMDLLYFMSRAHAHRGDVAMAVRTLTDVKDMAEDLQDDEQEASATHEIAKLYLGERVGSADGKSVDKAIRAATQAKGIFTRADLKDEQASTMLTVAFGYLAMRDPARAADLATDAEDVFTEVGWHLGVDAALNLQIEAYLEDERLEPALDAAMRRKNLWLDLNNKRLLANAYTSLATVHLALDDPLEAELSATDGLKIFKELEEVRGEAAALLLLTQAQTAKLAKEDVPDTSKPSQELDQFARVRAAALTSAEQAVEAAARSSDRPLTGLALLWHSRVLLYGLKSAAALQVAQESEKVFTDLVDGSGVAQALLVIGNAHSVLGERAQAIEVLERCLAQAQQAEDSKTAAQAKEVIDALTAKPVVAAPVATMQAIDASATGEAAAVASSAPAPDAKPVFDMVAARKKLFDIVMNVITADDEIEADSPLMEAGMDSLSSVQLVSEVSKAFEISLAPSVVFDYPTINALVENIAEEIGA